MTIAAFNTSGAWNNADNETVLIRMTRSSSSVEHVTQKASPSSLINSRHNEMLLRAWMP